MIPQRDDSIALLTEEHKPTRKRRTRRRAANENNDSCGANVPLEILVDHIVPFLDRRTYNSCLLLCKKARRTLRASWSKNGSNYQQQLPPWPQKLISRDHSCRIRCLVFSEDNSLLASGCSDGKIRSWDVRFGEFPTGEGHWEDEAVVALAFSNDNDKRLLASSSTDGTIRIWKIGQPTTKMNRQYSAKRTFDTMHTETTTKQEMSSFGKNDNCDVGSPSLEPPQCLLCVSSNHAVSLHFSPDDLYLVSGHLAMRNAQDVMPTSTIEIREVRTGLQLRRIEGGGVPVGFIQPSPIIPKTDQCDIFRQSPWGSNNMAVVSEEEHQLITTCGPNTSLKLWSWNRIQCVIDEQMELSYENAIFENFDQLRRDHRSRDETGEQSIPIDMASNLRHDRNNRMEKYKTSLANERCIRQWSLGRFNTVLPLSKTAGRKKDSNQLDYRNEYDNESANASCAILVAVINEPSKNSFTVWNTKCPDDSKIFCNTSPYEIQFSPDGTKIASVDDFNTVKVWRICDGKLLKTFSGSSESSENNHNYRHDAIQFEEDEDDSDETTLSHCSSDCENGLFPIHELVFSKDSSTVAVISRCYNELHLFST